MKIILYLGAGLVLLVFLVLVIGSLLPRQHVATRSIVLRQSAAAVFATVRDFDALPGWRTGLNRVELLPPANGRVSYREHSKHGAITYEVVEETSAQRLVVRIADASLPFGGTWSFALTPAATGGTNVRITEDGEVKNVIFRFMARFVFGYTSTMETYLTDLARKFGEAAPVQP